MKVRCFLPPIPRWQRACQNKHSGKNKLLILHLQALHTIRLHRFFQNMGTFPQGIAGGYNIVDQKNAFSVKQCFPPRGIYALYIFPPHSFGKGMLRGVFPDLYQRSLVRQVQMQRCLLCKQRRLVISALPSPLCRKRHTCNKIKDHRIFPPYSVCNRSGHLLCILRTVVKFKT